MSYQDGLVGANLNTINITQYGRYEDQCLLFLSYKKQATYPMITIAMNHGSAGAGLGSDTCTVDGKTIVPGLEAENSTTVGVKLFTGKSAGRPNICDKTISALMGLVPTSRATVSL